MTRSAAVLVLVPLLAGCLADEVRTPVTVETGLDLTQRAERFPGDRPVVASATLHEEVDQALVDLPLIDGDDPWGPRDFKLTYHGVQEVYDAFARRVQGYVFRSSAMVFEEDSV